MKKYLGIGVIYVAVLLSLIVTAAAGSRVVTVLSEQKPLKTRKCVIIDAGHGGVDGGATSCTGILESQINLEIALRLDDLMHFLGIHTQMIRSDDRSVYTDGKSIATKKVSDLKERVKIVNNTDNAILVSIHQNHFYDSKYHGAQVFYASSPGSNELAKSMQTNIIANINPGSNRNIKKGDGIFLLEKITCPGILIECGFLSNPEEEARLRSADYQLKLCSVIVSVCSVYLHGRVA